MNEIPIIRKTVTLEEWQAEGKRLFGDDMMLWRFVCPSCSHVTLVGDWKRAGAPETAVAFSCVGRWTGTGDENTFKRAGGPCIYAGGGLIGLNPVTVIDKGGAEHHVFSFAPLSTEKPL